MQNNVQIKTADRDFDINDLKKALQSQNYISESIINDINSYKIIKITNNNEILGYILIKHLDLNNPLYFLMSSYCQLLIIMHYEYRGKGFAKIAINQLFENKPLLINIKFVEALICHGNEISKKLFTSLNFEKTYNRENYSCYQYTIDN